jgi:hypothetical protein
VRGDGDLQVRKIVEEGHEPAADHGGVSVFGLGAQPLRGEID